MNKKILSCIAAVVLLAGTFTACGGKKPDDEVSFDVITNNENTEGTEEVTGSDSEEEGEPVNSDNAETTVTTAKKKDKDKSKDNNGDSEAGETISVTTAGTTAATELYGLDNPEEQLGTEQQTVATTVIITTPANDVVDETQQSVNEQDVIDALTSEEPTNKTLGGKYNVSPSDRYGYNQLSSSEKKLYDLIVDGAKNGYRNLDIDEDLSQEEWIKVFGCAYVNEPQLFWLSSKNRRGVLFYWLDRESIARCQKEIEAKAKEVVALADGKSDYDKVRTFHDWIVTHAEFKKASADDSEDSWMRYTVYGGLIAGEVQCEGYAKTMQYLCDLAGVESLVVIGTNSEGSSHAWNVIKLGGNWYNVDCTWDDPILSTPVANNLRHRYFAVPDEWIHNKSHYNVNKKTTGTQVVYFKPPACTNTDMNYFAKQGLLYSDFSSAEKALKEQLKTAASNKTRVAEIRVSSKSVYDEVTSHLKDYATWIKGEYSSVKKVASNCDENTLVIEIDLGY